jgi:hypothetical protein
MRKNDSSFWTYLLTTFLAGGLALAILPGCGDDTEDSDSDSRFDSDFDSPVDSFPTQD